MSTKSDNLSPQNMKHTPGPWIYDDNCIGVSDSPWDKEPFITSRICEMLGDHVTCDEDDANGILIAAAPDLLMALKTLVDLYIANPGTNHEFITCITPPHASDLTKALRKKNKAWSAFDAARLVITKAEGK